MARERTLDRAAVVQAAIALADAGGAEQLTLARLAEQLKIRTPSLYNHVDGLDGLWRELQLHGLREMATRLARAAVGRSAEDAVLALADAYRSFAREHPGLYATTTRAVGPGDPQLSAASAEVLEIVVASLAGYNLAEDDALHAVRGLRSIVHGFVSLETGGGFGLPLDLDESFRRLVRAFAQGLRRDISGT